MVVVLKKKRQQATAGASLPEGRVTAVRDRGKKLKRINGQTKELEEIRDDKDR